MSTRDLNLLDLPDDLTRAKGQLITAQATVDVPPKREMSPIRRPRQRRWQDVRVKARSDKSTPPRLAKIGSRSAMREGPWCV